MAFGRRVYNYKKICEQAARLQFQEAETSEARLVRAAKKLDAKRHTMSVKQFLGSLKEDDKKKGVLKPRKKRRLLE